MFQPDFCRIVIQRRYGDFNLFFWGHIATAVRSIWCQREQAVGLVITIDMEGRRACCRSNCLVNGGNVRLVADVPLQLRKGGRGRFKGMNNRLGVQLEKFAGRLALVGTQVEDHRVGLGYK